MEPTAINPWELKSLSLLLTMSPSTSPFPVSPESISVLFTHHPLFSFTISLCVLIILYFPRALGFFLSPVIVVITALSLLCLLRLGTVQRAEKNREREETVEPRSEVEEKSGSLAGSEESELRDQGFEVSFVQWDVGAPLEVIYEEGEGDDGGDGRNSKGGGEERDQKGLERYPSLSMYYPETDSDCSSDDCGDFSGGWDLAAEGGGFKWEEEDREELLIEIALDRSSTKGKGKELEFEFDSDFNSDMGFHGEEENLIEIDISPAKLDDVFPGEV